MGSDSYSRKTKRIVEADDNLTPKQKRRVITSLLPYVMLTVDDLNDFESSASEPESPAESTVSASTEVEEPVEPVEPKPSPFKTCPLCPGRRMLTDADMEKHLNSKLHLKKASRQ